MKTAILPGWMPMASWRAAAWRTFTLTAVALTVLVGGCSSAKRQSAGSPAAAPAPPPSGVVSSARVRQPAAIEALEVSDDGRLLELKADRPLVWTSFRDAEGALVIELPNSVPQPEVGDVQRTSGLVTAVDVELLEDADRPLTRLTVRTRESSEHSLTGDDAMLRIELLPVEESAAAALAYEPLPADSGGEVEVAEASPEAAPPKMASAPPPPMPRTSAPPPQIYGTAEAPLHGPRPTGVVASQLFSVDVVERGAGKTVIRVDGDGEFEYSTFRLESPERFVVDLGGVINNSQESLVPVDSDQVAQVRVGQFKPQPEAVSRVVFDLQQFVLPSIQRTSDGLTMTFDTSAAAAGAEPVAAMADMEPMPEESPFEESMPPSPEAAEFEPAAPEPAAPQPAAAEPTLVADLMAEEEPMPAAAPQAGPPQVSFEAHPDSPAAAEVPMYEPMAPPPPQAAAARPVGTSDVAMFEAQEIQIEPEPEMVDPVLESFGALVVSRREPEYVGEPIDMSLRQADLVETLRSFASISDLNFVIQPGVAGTVTVELKGVPWDQAMTQILKINNLGMDIEGTIVRIAPLSQLRAEAEEQRQLRAARQQSVPLRTVLKGLSYSTAEDVATLLRNRTGSILSNRGTVQVDRRTNTLIIQELPDNVDTVLAVIDNLDAPEPQVTIEARIIEATKSFSRSLGIEWGYDFAANQANGNTTGLQFPSNVDTDGGVNLLTGGATGFINMRLGSILNTFNLDVRLQAAENEGLVNLVSAPRVTTLNNTQASIQSGFQLPIQTVSNRTVSVQFVNATLQLQVTPQVTAEGTIVLDIQVAKRSPAPGLVVAGATNSPIQTREARTRVIVRDGGTTVIGGIYEVSANQLQDRVPGLANIPVIGHLFKNRNRQNSNDELMIFITPRIVQM